MEARYVDGFAFINRDGEQLKKLIDLALVDPPTLEGDDAAITLAELGIKVVRPPYPSSKIIRFRRPR